MRRKFTTILFFVANLLVLSFLLYTVWPLLALLVVDGRSDQISRAELPAPDSNLVGGRPHVIPKIIHQTYKSCAPTGNNSIPAIWRDAQQSCIDLHPDYEYKCWSDESSREFIVKEYPWFLNTWDHYPYPIQRADAIRYFVLVHYGGIYIDLDDGCQRSLDPLLSYPAWVRATRPTGISNDVMGSVPAHPFFLRVIDALPAYARSWYSPYITIMSSTGPLFLSLVWRRYSTAAHGDHDRVRILFPDEYMSYSWSFFSHHSGNSWHMWDANAIFWMSSHWIYLTVIGFAVGLVVLGLIWWAFFTQAAKSQSLLQRMVGLRRWSTKKDDVELTDVRLGLLPPEQR